MIVSQRLITDVNFMKWRNDGTLHLERPHSVEITCLLPDCDLLEVRNCVH